MSVKKANTHSRKCLGIRRKFADPESLWAACSEYFKWVAANPVERCEPLARGGEVAVKATPRVASQRQLCRFLDVGKTTWHRYRQNQRFAEVINRVEATVRTQNADAAAVRLCAKKPPKKGSRCRASAVEGQSSPNAGAPPVEASHRRREFKKGNQLWRKRSSHGPAPKFSDPESLWAACLEYFDWAFDTPLEQDKIFNVKGELKHEPLERMRAMTIHGLCIFLDISTSTWNRHRNREGFTEVTDRVESIIRTQKFEGAAADLLNSKIISRDLKLGEREQAALDEQRKAKVQSDADDVTRKLLPEAFAGDEESAA